VTALATTGEATGELEALGVAAPEARGTGVRTVVSEQAVKTRSREIDQCRSFIFVSDRFLGSGSMKPVIILLRYRDSIKKSTREAMGKF
jgi:hypothetical protein